MLNNTSVLLSTLWSRLLVPVSDMQCYLSLWRLSTLLHVIWMTVPHVVVTDNCMCINTDWIHSDRSKLHWWAVEQWNTVFAYWTIYTYIIYIYVCICDVCVYVCVYVCMYIYIYIILLLATEFKEIFHSLDVRHKSKAIRKCLAKVSNRTIWIRCLIPHLSTGPTT